MKFKKFIIFSLFVLFGAFSALALDTGDLNVLGTLDVAGNSDLSGDLNVDGVFSVDDIVIKSPYIDVRAYGAVGNGTADDTAAIQAAIDGATVGDIIFFPRGLYKVTSRITINTNRLTLMGVGMQSQVVLIPTAANVHCFQVTDDCDNVTFKDLTIYSGDEYNQTVGVYIEDEANTIMFDHVFFATFTKAAVWAEGDIYGRFYKCRFYNMDNSYYDSSPAYGIYFVSLANNVDIIDCKFISNDWHMRILGGNQVNVIGNCFALGGDSGNTFGFGPQLAFDGVTGLNIIGNFFESNLTGNTSAVIDIGASPSPVISGNIFSGESGASVVSERFIAIDTTSRNYLIQNNWFSEINDYFVTAVPAGRLIGNYYENGGVELTTYADIMVKMSIGEHYFIHRDGSVINTSSTVYPTNTLQDAATPTVAGGTLWLTGGTTTITDFDDGVTGQVITVIAEHSVTITDGTNIFLNGSANFVMAATDTLTLVCKADNKWYELSRSDN